jgi:hypothetical protein
MSSQVHPYVEWEEEVTLLEGQEAYLAYQKKMMKMTKVKIRMVIFKWVVVTNGGL